MPHRVVLVVAGALQRGDGAWLMQRRPLQKPHGGLWEFPGGKVEPAEMPGSALVRELHEELGICVEPADCSPVAFAEGREPELPYSIVILLYIVHRWRGTARALEGGRVNWFTEREVLEQDTPPLDRVLARRLLGDR